MRFSVSNYIKIKHPREPSYKDTLRLEAIPVFHTLVTILFKVSNLENSLHFE